MKAHFTTMERMNFTIHTVGAWFWRLVQTYHGWCLLDL